MVIGLSDNVFLIAGSLLLGGAVWLTLLTTFDTNVQMNGPEWSFRQCGAFDCVTDLCAGIVGRSN